MIGQPPRQKGEGYDQRELARWFDDIHRWSKTVAESLQVESTTASSVTNEYGSSTTTINYNAKRYLRWINC
jgi:hypothetical protein